MTSSLFDSNSNPTRRTAILTGGAAAAAAAAGLTAPLSAAAAPRKPPKGGDERRATLLRWARDTWRSLDAMAFPATGLPADNIDGDLTGPARYTSPTNIGGYLWSTLIARELGFLTPGHARQRVARTLDTLGKLERHEPSGMYANWYDPQDGRMLTEWPEDGSRVVPFISSVDMGWLGAALHVVANADPSNAKRARALFDRMRWDVFFDRDYTRKPGATVGGFWLSDPGRPEASPEKMPPMNGVGGPDIWYHITHHYDTAISEARMVTYLGIVRGQIPPGAYFTTYRTFPEDWTWQEMPPAGETRIYEGVDVYEGAYTYRGMHIVPGWGGSMFEELMPDLFVPEAEWAPRSWGLNHPLHVRAQREHGMDEARYGYWGFSPSSDPYGGYREYGVDALGLNPDGYFSDEEKTDYRWNAPPTSYGDGVVTPHAGFLGMQYDADSGFSNLRRIENELRAYGQGGFFDAVATRSGRIARRYLSLDQSMIMGAVGNMLLDGRLRSWFADAKVEAALRHVLAQEEFSAHA